MCEIQWEKTLHRRVGLNEWFIAPNREVATSTVGRGNLGQSCNILEFYRLKQTDLCKVMIALCTVSRLYK